MSNSIKCSQFEQKLKEKQKLFSLIDDDYQSFKPSKNDDFSSFQKHIKKYVDFSDNEPQGLNNLGSTLMCNFKFWAMLISMKLDKSETIKDSRIIFLQLMNTAIMFEVTDRKDFKEFFTTTVRRLFTDKMLLSLINQHRKPKLENRANHKVIIDNIQYILMYSDYFEDNLGEFEIQKSKKILGAKTEEVKEEDNTKTDDTPVIKKEKKESILPQKKKSVVKGKMKRKQITQPSIKEEKKNDLINNEIRKKALPKGKKKEEEKKKGNVKEKKKEIDIEELLYSDDSFDVMASLPESEMEKIFNEANNNENRKDSMSSLVLSEGKVDNLIEVSFSDDDIMDNGMSLLKQV